MIITVKDDNYQYKLYRCTFCLAQNRGKPVEHSSYCKSLKKTKKKKRKVKKN